MWEPCTHSFATKAPFETAMPGLDSSFGCCANVGRWTGQVLVWDIRLGRYAVGAVRLMISLESAGASTPSDSGGFFPATISPAFTTTSMTSAYSEAVAGSTSRRRAATKSAATTRSPLDQRASGRRLKVYCLPSALTDQSVATPGATPAVLSKVVSPSHKSRRMVCDSTERAFCGSRESGSAPAPLNRSWVVLGAGVGEREQPAARIARAASSRARVMGQRALAGRVGSRLSARVHYPARVDL